MSAIATQTRTRLRARTRLLLVAALAVVSISSVAFGYLTATSTPGANAPAVGAGTLPQASTPSVTLAGGTVRVDWTPTSFSPTLDYTVKRFPSNGTSTTGPGVAVSCTPTTIAGGDLRCVDASAAEGTFQYKVTATLNNWSGSDSGASSPVTVDGTAPTTTATLSPAANGAGWNNTSPVQVTLNAGDGGGSGVHKTYYTTDGSTPTTASTEYAGPFNVASTTDVRFFSTDNASNAESPKSKQVKIDTVAPANSLTLNVTSGSALRNGNTVFYRGAAPGSFTIANAVSDANSGPASSSTSALGGTTAGWNHVPSVTSAPSGGPYVSNAFSWSGGTTSSATVTVTGRDTADNTTASALTFTNDSTAPVTSVSVSPTPTGGWNNADVTVTLSAGDSAGSGVSEIRYTIDDTIPTASSPLYTGPFVVSSSANVRFFATDNLGNAEAPKLHGVQIDRNAPVPGLTFPVAGTTYAGTTWRSSSQAACNALVPGTFSGNTAGFCGTAADTGGSSVSRVEIQIVQDNTGNCWNTSTASFAVSCSSASNWIVANGTTSWSVPFTASQFTANNTPAQSFTVRARATDVAGNITAGGSQLVRTFTIDN